jgi:hypothetical protein
MMRYFSVFLYNINTLQDLIVDKLKRSLCGGPRTKKILSGEAIDNCDMKVVVYLTQAKKLRELHRGLDGRDNKPFTALCEPICCCKFVVCVFVSGVLVAGDGAVVCKVITAGMVAKADTKRAHTLNKGILFMIYISSVVHRLRPIGR